MVDFAALQLRKVTATIGMTMEARKRGTSRWSLDTVLIVLFVYTLFSRHTPSIIQLIPFVSRPDVLFLYIFCQQKGALPYRYYSVHSRRQVMPAGVFLFLV